MNRLSDYADIFMTAPCYLGYFWMAGKFCKKYLGASGKREVLFVVSSFFSCLLLNLASRRYYIPYILLVMLDHVLFMGLVLLFFQESREKKILAASLLMAAMKLVANISIDFLSCLVLFFQHTVEGVQAPLVGGWESAVAVCVSLCLVTLAVCRMSRHLAPVFWGEQGKRHAVLAAPLLAIIAVVDVADWGASHGIMPRSGGGLGLYYDQLIAYGEFAVLAAICLSAAGFYVFGMSRIYGEQEKSSRYHSQLAVYKMLAGQHRQSERLRHDMKNHVISLSALFQDKEWEKLGAYLKKMGDRCLETGGDMTGNRAVDALLHQKRRRAEEEKIGWECDVQIPGGCGINEFDLCVLFGNLLDNALEACGRQQGGEGRFIHVRARAVKKCFLLEVKNSMDRAEKYAGGFTGKENPQEHGIGLLNVRDVVQGYDGVVEAGAGAGSFTVSILMPLCDSHDTAHDIKTTV